MAKNFIFSVLFEKFSLHSRKNEWDCYFLSFKVSKEPQVQIEILWHFFAGLKPKLDIPREKKVYGD